ncbi:MAG: hypothetical protein K2Y32_11845 [Candidatus Obscuribacterales bacterium]|nr:hypothetical protein [Candidatus Obscuribacterales bacterium]
MANKERGPKSTSPITRHSRWPSWLAVFVCLVAWLSLAPVGAPGEAIKRLISFSTGFCSTCQKQELDPSVPFIKSISGEAVPADLEAMATELAKRTRVQIVENDGRFSYILHAGGESKTLFTTTRDAKGLQEGEARIKELVTLKIKELGEEPLKASFALENELVEEQKSLSTNQSESKPLILSRSPQLVELHGIEAALKRSFPSHLAPGDKQGLKFYFLKAPLYKEELGFAYYATDKDKRKAIYFTPGATDNLRPTEKDAPSWASQSRFKKDGYYFDTIESLLIHELAHNHQERMGWEDQDSKVLDTMSDKLGFVKTQDPQSGARVFYIKVARDKIEPQSKTETSTKSENQAESETQAEPLPTDPYVYFKVERPTNAKLGKRWLRVDLQGQLLDQSGKAVSKLEEAHILSNKEIRAIALVRPATDYFDNPIEVFAESMRLYRMGGEARDLLYQESPLLYKITAEQDQAELDLYFGYFKVFEKRTLFKGDKPVSTTEIDSVQPVFTRNWQGDLVRFSPELVEAIKAKEKSLGPNQ